MGSGRRDLNPDAGASKVRLARKLVSSTDGPPSPLVGRCSERSSGAHRLCMWAERFDSKLGIGR